eukprot:TRINITY_DN25465_c0_g1_i1.p1 TRINITY_DN25465_c0_g1~~TRINITY_DN25465_c0_g1_i1.p1  ORF type:complete len:363 (+),score=58.86 TRINITY_DN25465_c0_g1_i1:67-1089(+)
MSIRRESAPEMHFTASNGRWKGRRFFTTSKAAGQARPQHLHGDGKPRARPGRLQPITRTPILRSGSCPRYEEKPEVVEVVELDEFEGIDTGGSISITPLVSMLFSLQKAGGGDLIRKITSVSQNELEHRMISAGYEHTLLTKHKFLAMLEVVLNIHPDDLDHREALVLFTLFDADDSKTIDPQEFRVGVHMLKNSNAAELVMKRVHSLLQLGNRCYESSQFITRYDLQLIYESVANFNAVTKGKEVGEHCSRTLMGLMGTYTWDKARIPAQSVRLQIFTSPLLLSFFNLHDQANNVKQAVKTCVTPEPLVACMADTMPSTLSTPILPPLRQHSSYVRPWR